MPEVTLSYIVLIILCTKKSSDRAKLITLSLVSMVSSYEHVTSISIRTVVTLFGQCCSHQAHHQ